MKKCDSYTQKQYWKICHGILGNYQILTAEITSIVRNYQKGKQREENGTQFFSQNF